MTPLTIAISALVIGLVVGSATVIGAPILALPIVLVALLAIGVGQLNRRTHEARSLEEFRRQAAAEKVEFTERDRETTVPAREVG